MPDIKTITLPSGNTYDICDATAREAIAQLNNTQNVLSTDAASTPYGVTWVNSQEETIVGTLVASAETIKKIYLVPSSKPETKNVYNEYLTLLKNNEYSWEQIGSTEIDLSGLGALAWKDTAQTTYTPAGEVSQPSFEGDTLTSTGSYTPTGEITIEVGSGVANYTPSGEILAPEISVASAGSTADINSISNAGSLPSLSATVSDGNLVLSWDAGTLPSYSGVTVKTGDASYEASQPSFNGTSVELHAVFSGATDTLSVSGTPTGTVSKPSFTGEAATLTVS